MKFYSLLTD